MEELLLINSQNRNIFRPIKDRKKKIDVKMNNSISPVNDSEDHNTTSLLISKNVDQSGNFSCMMEKNTVTILSNKDVAKKIYESST